MLMLQAIKNTAFESFGSFLVPNVVIMQKLNGRNFSAEMIQN